MENDSSDLKFKFYAVCGFCHEHNKDSVVLEFNFKEQSIYYMCPKCKKQNKLCLGTNVPPPYPKSRTFR